MTGEVVRALRKSDAVLVVENQGRFQARPMPVEAQD
jgi:hypothetical protein